MFKKGDRIRLVRMTDDPDPIPVGACGTVIHTVNFRDSVQVWVRWDNGRSLSLIVPPDRAVLLPKETP